MKKAIIAILIAVTFTACGSGEGTNQAPATVDSTSVDSTKVDTTKVDTTKAAVDSSK